MKITRSQLKQIIKEELSGLTEEDHLAEKSQYEEGSAGYHMEQAIRMARELDEIEQAMPKRIRSKYASGQGHKIEEELDIALEVMDNTIDYYESIIRELRADRRMSGHRS